MSTEAARPAVSFFRAPTDGSRLGASRQSTARLCHEVLRLDHLHYGLWDGGARRHGEPAHRTRTATWSACWPRSPPSAD
ncbi:MAG: hypothetical protein R2862_01060 [Thermoanaerobaculia bacterium]